MPIVQVRWQWLFLLVGQIVLSAMVMVSTMYLSQSSGIHVLKDSSIATLCLLNQKTRDELRSFIGSAELEKKAREKEVRLSLDGSRSNMYSPFPGNAGEVERRKEP